MDTFSRSLLLLFVLLNPFIMSVYLMELVKGLTFSYFARQLIRAGMISFTIFLLFAWTGDAVFENVMQVRFSSFLIFGGITFLIAGIRLILGVGPPIQALRPESGQVSAAIAMPFMVGPGTISASVVIGSRLNFPMAASAIGLALLFSIAAILLIKIFHDFFRNRNEPLVQRYSEIAGRVTALFVGSFAVEMIFTGIERWLTRLQGVG